MPTIVAPGCWGLFGGHLDPGERPEQALRLVMVHHIHRRTAHVFWGELSVPLEQLQLLEGQDLALVSLEDLLRVQINRAAAAPVTAGVRA